MELRRHGGALHPSGGRSPRCRCPRSVVAPVLGSYVFFTFDEQAALRNVQWVYLAIACFVFSLAAVVFFIFVKPINKLRNLRAKPQADPAAPLVPEDIQLLTEIRDLLKTPRS